MSNYRTVVRAAARTLTRFLPPQDCQLCDGPAGSDFLCSACLSSLPRLDEPRCPVCALPTQGGDICGACLRHRPHYDATFALWHYEFPADRLIHALKYAHRLAVADFIARCMLSDAPSLPGDATLIPIPLSPGRLRERGFNQSLEVAKPLALALGLRLGLTDVLRAGETAPQATLPWKERQRNIRHAFECRADLSGRTIVVVDDVMTTGATLDEFARTLKNHGAAKVINWVCARALKP